MDNNVDDLLSQLDAQESSQPAASKSSGLDYLLSAAGYAFRQSNPMYQMDRSMETMGKVGAFAKKGNKQLQSLVMQKAGEAGPVAAGAATLPMVALGTLNEFLPETKDEAYMTTGGEIAGGLSRAGRAEDAINRALRAQGKKPVLQPGPIDKTLGSAVTVETAVPEKYSQAVMADPSILGDITETRSAVGRQYGDYFKRKGMDVSGRAKELFDSRFIPQSVQPHTKLLDEVADKLDMIDELEKSGAKLSAQDKLNFLSAEDAVLGKRAADLIQNARSANTPLSNLKTAGALESRLKDYLESVGDDELRQLDRKYFRAAAKEQFESALPRNKNMSPNALRGFAMLNLLGQAGSDLAEGKLIRAGAKGVQAAAMSPALMGTAIREMGDVTPNLYRILGSGYTARRRNGR